MVCPFATVAVGAGLIATDVRTGGAAMTMTDADGSLNMPLTVCRTITLSFAIRAGERPEIVHWPNASPIPAAPRGVPLTNAWIEPPGSDPIPLSVVAPALSDPVIAGGKGLTVRTVVADSMPLAVARMFATPAAMPTTRPLASIGATAVLSLFQIAASNGSCTEPSENVPRAAN